MVLNEHVVMLNAIRMEYHNLYKQKPEAHASILHDIDAMYDAFIEEGDMGAFIPDCPVAHLNVTGGELLC